MSINWNLVTDSHALVRLPHRRPLIGVRFWRGILIGSAISLPMWALIVWAFL